MASYKVEEILRLRAESDKLHERAKVLRKRAAGQRHRLTDEEKAELDAIYYGQPVDV